MIFCENRQSGHGEPGESELGKFIRMICSLKDLLKHGFITPYMGTNWCRNHNLMKGWLFFIELTLLSDLP